MGEACGTYGEEMRGAYSVFVRKLRERSYLEDLGVDGDNIKNNL
jgi:hypothetical protein